MKLAAARPGLLQRAKKWFYNAERKPGVISSSPADSFSSMSAASIATGVVGTAAAATVAATSPGLLMGAALTVGLLAAGTVVGALGTGGLYEMIGSAIGADTRDEGGSIAGGAVLGFLAAGASIAAASFGAVPITVGLTVAGGTAVLSAALARATG